MKLSSEVLFINYMVLTYSDLQIIDSCVCMYVLMSNSNKLLFVILKYLKICRVVNMVKIKK